MAKSQNTNMPQIENDNENTVSDKTLLLVGPAISIENIYKRIVTNTKVMYFA